MCGFVGVYCYAGGVADRALIARQNLGRHARHAWPAIRCILASLVLARPAPAAGKIHRNTDASSVRSSATLQTPTAAPARQAAVGVPLLYHVIVVVMENNSYDQVRTLPYISTLIGQYTSFSQSYAVSHPSEPNYLAMWAASTMGLTDDSCPPPGSPYSVENLGHSCEAAGLTWKSYCENLPSVGSTVCSSSDNLYERKHHPCPDFSNCNHAWECPYGQLSTDIAGGRLPNLSFVVPNMCDDMHDCSDGTGDTWLSNNMPAMISAVGPRGLVVLTWDEDDSANHILTVFAGPAAKTNYVSSQTFNHYTLVRTICEVFGLSPFANASLETAPADVWNSTGAKACSWGEVMSRYHPASGAAAAPQDK